MHGGVAERAHWALQCGLFEACFLSANFENLSSGLARMGELAEAALDCEALTPWERLALRCARLYIASVICTSTDELAAAFADTIAAVAAARCDDAADTGLRDHCHVMIDAAAVARALRLCSPALLERGPLSAHLMAVKEYRKLLDPEGGKLEALMVRRSCTCMYVYVHAPTSTYAWARHAWA